MSRTLILLAFLITSALAGNAAAQVGPRVVPDLTGYFLDGREISIPADLTGAATLIVFSRENAETQDVESWRQVAAQIDDVTPTIFVVLMGNQRGIGRSMAAGRLRAQVSDPEIRASMVPIFQDVGDLQASLRLGPGVTALVVNAAGEVIWQASGAASEDTVQILENLPAQSPAITSLPEKPREVAALLQTPVMSERAAPSSAPSPAPVLVATGIAVSEGPARLPAYEGVTLDGRSLRLPGDLSPDGTRLVFIAEWEDGEALRTVLARMEEASGEYGDDWLVLVFKGKAPQLGRAFASGKLRAEVPEAARRRHVLPVYKGISDFEASLGLEASRAPRIVTVAPDGAIVGVACPGEDC
ncbi:hypothetical protein [Hyphomonas sp.]|uniref:hypothetical protein n=1 Tax=Hyphomonas sp. TaxID=87 RepID=UPI0025BD1361|nr:hypothetical protein [Hyphomonas sp.]